MYIAAMEICFTSKGSSDTNVYVIDMSRPAPKAILLIRILQALIMLPTQTKLFQAECVAFVILPSVHN